MRRRIAAGWHEELARAAATAYAIEHFCAPSPRRDAWLATTLRAVTLLTLHLHRLRAGPEPWEDA
jgi:hypothetical protein